MAETLIPRNASRRPRVGDLVVPFMVDDRIQPIDFRIVHAGHVLKCARERKCGICGRPISGYLAFCGPDDDRNCFADPWMHIDCGILAMRQCPFLADRKGWRGEVPPGLRGEFMDRYTHNMALVQAPDGRAFRDSFGHWHFEAHGRLRRVLWT